MIQAAFNLFVFLGVLFGVAGVVCYFRVLYHTTDPGYSWYGSLLLFRPYLLTAKGRRLRGISLLCTAAAFVLFVICMCLSPALPNP